MLQGDLSNEAPGHCIVTLDAMLDGKIPKKGVFKSWDVIASLTPINTLALGRLWRATNQGVRFEVVAFDVPRDYTVALEEHFDRLGSPIKWVTPYTDRLALQHALAYRPDVIAVIDDPEKALMWGSRGRSITDL